MGVFALKPQIDDLVGMKEKYPELVEIGYLDPAKYRYFNPAWDKRTSNYDVGETHRPY